MGYAPRSYQMARPQLPPSSRIVRARQSSRPAHPAGAKAGVVKSQKDTKTTARVPPVKRCAEPLYGIYFPEGPGFLYSAFLGQGVDGVAVKVRSLADGKVYVRKKTLARATNKETGVQNPEVGLYRAHPNIPQLLNSESYPCGESKDGIPKFSDAMIFNFCNGPTLACAMKLPGFKACTLFKWKVFDQLLDVFEHLHRSPSAVGHGDAHQNNIFLHFPEYRTGLPEVFLGDFSRAQAIDPTIWIATEGPDAYKIKEEKVKMVTKNFYGWQKDVPLWTTVVPEETPYLRSVQLITKDLEDVARVMAFLMTGTRAYDDREAEELEYRGGDPDEELAEDPCSLLRYRGWDGSYPEPLFVLWQALDRMVRHMKKLRCEVYDKFPKLREWVSGMAAEEAERVRLNGSEQDMSWLTTDRVAFSKYWSPGNEPKLYHSEEWALGQHGETAGPFRIAKVDSITFEVLEIGDEEHLSHLPEDYNYY
ncbi:hypothetical protein LTR10_019685 [Elasticomyces elasticus]|uniref:Protein kinase domain-containing protein n=1 Tax=Exophiala sideris TaxID=1016849 RepID=A0ABR0IXY8_9EURO|nr:hypothetical protein LTR10_019685 [Elasticomyces elasticus]KAK5022095.1 hypothetical protein LTS07_010344 [Exophiala sideris]KAK5023554.1 hypothetical protein LTR13_011143 [Exophiala sideris]KAK5051194.1 hypothetical protein LTR69_010406 [Exophiala sideris]KAK5176250.1 hypothetical protein LTR44_011221 [Eurotiomycetes sp. CCFEE 6388]